MYFSVVSTQVFATVAHNDEPITTVPKCDPQCSEDVDPHLGLFHPRHITAITMFLPSIATILVVAYDFCSLFMPSPFREGGELLIQHLSKSPRESAQAIIMLVVGGIFAITTFILNWSAFGFQRGNGKLLQDVYKSIVELRRKEQADVSEASPL